MTRSISEIEGRLLSRQVLKTERAKAILATPAPRWARALCIMTPYGALVAFGGPVQKALDVGPHVPGLFAIAIMAIALASYEIIVLHRRVAALTHLLVDR